MSDFVTVFLVVTAYLVCLTAVLHILPRLGEGGRAALGWLEHAPGLDVLIYGYQVVPLVFGAVYAGWSGLGAALCGGLLTYFLWVTLHEYKYREILRDGPRIVTALNKVAGSRFRQQAALWATTLAFPVFWVIRLAELVVYPILVWGVKLPTYNQAEWVNVSRHKFDGLVGHDRLWCLYCDWMTGIYSLGAEMLRNIESFWCPIRFQSGKKCENCKLDFPDVENGWVDSCGSMADVVAKIEASYANDEPNRWFGHPDRGENQPEPIDKSGKSKEGQKMQPADM